MRVYNFSPGPSALPEKVLKKAQAEFLDYNGTGMSVVEMSHRSKPFEAVVTGAAALLRELMNIPENYEIIFVQGGASTQFEAVPLNLLKNGKADYVITGNFAKKAFEEAQKYGEIKCIATSKDKNFTYIPKLTEDMFTSGADYVHICTNNTIFGSKFAEIPTTKTPLVADMSSNILSERIDVSKFGVIYAGAQKNIAPAGATVVIVRKDLLDQAMPICPTMLKWKTQVSENSLYNTPSSFSIYMAKLMFEWLKGLGGIKAIEEINYYKANLLYDCIDNSNFYVNKVEKPYRSIMNIPFVTPSEELDEKFIKEAAKQGLTTLKGHRLVGGMRASIYNAMPIEGVKKLVEFMKEFELNNK